MHLKLILQLRLTKYIQLVYNLLDYPYLVIIKVTDFEAGYRILGFQNVSSGYPVFKKAAYQVSSHIMSLRKSVPDIRGSSYWITEYELARYLDLSDIQPDNIW